MARRAIEHAGLRYTIADDDPARQDLLPWAVLRTRVIDELTLAPPIAPVALTSTLPGARSRAADGGVCGLVARPRDVSSALVTPGAFTARVTAPGYLPRDLTPAIEEARRALSTPAPGAVLDVLPGDPDPPRAQFLPGRGVMIERPVPTEPEQFTTVAAVLPPPTATDVPVRDQVDPARLAGTRVAGVPMVLPDQPLHRDAALRIRGRIRHRTGPNSIVPAVGARVGILGVWWDYPSSIASLPLAPDVCAIEPPLRRAYPVGATVHSCGLNPVGGMLALAAFAPLASQEIVVAPSGALNPLGGDLIRLGDPVTGDDEVVVSAGFDPPTDAAAPARIALRAPTGAIHRSGEPAQVVQAVGVAAVGAVTREGLAGDRVLFASNVPGLATIATLIVDHLTPRASFYRATQFPFTPDGVAFSHHVLPDTTTGRFAWPPLSRLAQIRVIANFQPAVPLPLQLDVALDYGGDASLAIVLT
ncbi:MAG TPA: hypothetical protein VFZ36_07100 [Vicinamibacterales bacterium]